MTAEHWWAVLLDGTLAAVIGLVGVFVALRLTLRHERELSPRSRITEALTSVIVTVRGKPLAGSPTEVQSRLHQLTGHLALYQALARKPAEHFGAAWVNNLTQDLMQAYIADATEYTSAVRLDQQTRPRWHASHM